MRAGVRLLAAVERSSRFLEAGTPTGLTGLLTHGSPRTALLYLYGETLNKLKQFPEHSVYRQSTEALTKHRMKVIESVKPEGLEQWQQRVAPLLEEHPNAIRKLPLSSASGSSEFNIVWKERHVNQVSEDDMDGDARQSTFPKFGEGASSVAEGELKQKHIARAEKSEQTVHVHIEPEPPLTVEQIGEIETKLEAGLIEEIIQVAQAEDDLASVMLENAVWEDLEEKPVEGQWTYHERDKGTRGTEAKA